MTRTTACLAIHLAEILGGGSLLLFAVFLFAGPVVSVPLGFSERGALAWDALLSLLFFTQHSLMVRRRFKDWLARRLAPEFHGAIYAVASGVALGLAMGFWQPVTSIVFEVPAPGRWVLRGAAVLSMVGFVWGARALRTFDTFGRGPIVARLRGRPVQPPVALVVRGPYQWVRHPLMLFMLVLIWANPDVSLDRMLFNVLWTAWIILGSHLEERDLVAEFGERYRAYQRVVPMLVPWRGPAGRVLQTRPAAPLEPAVR